MAEAKSKFSGMFNRPAEPEAVIPADRAELPPAHVPAPMAVPHGTRPIGRPPGKRSDPAWKQYSILLRRDTQREAANILRDKDEGDFSALVQNLVEGWLKKQRG